MRNGWPALVGVLSLAVIATPSVDARGSNRQRCFPHRARTVLEDRRARVYGLVYRGYHEIWGCSLQTGRRSFLGLRNFSNSEGDYAAPIVLRGPFVGVNVSESGHDTGTYATVSTYDLRSGKRLHVWMQGGDTCVNATVVTELRVTGTGAAAWIAEAEFGCGPTTNQVFRADTSSRHVRRLDEGTDIDPQHLVVKAGRIYWKHGGATRSAPIR